MIFVIGAPGELTRRTVQQADHVRDGGVDGTDQRRGPRGLQRELPFRTVRLDDVVRRGGAAAAAGGRGRARGPLRRRGPGTERTSR